MAQNYLMYRNNNGIEVFKIDGKESASEIYLKHAQELGDDYFETVAYLLRVQGEHIDAEEVLFP